MGEPEARTSISVYLTRREWKACWGVYLVGLYIGSLGTGELFFKEGEEFSLGRALLHGIEVLQRAGYKFRAVRLDEEGTLHIRQRKPVEPLNALFVAMFASGDLPDPDTAFESLEELIQDYGLNMDRREVWQARRVAGADIEEARKMMSDEERKEYRMRVEEAKQTFEELGFVPTGTRQDN